MPDNCRHDEVAGVGWCGAVDELPAPVGFGADLAVDVQTVSGRHDQTRPPQITGLIPALEPTDAFQAPLSRSGDRRVHGHACAGGEQVFGFSRGDLAGANDDDRLAGEIKKKWIAHGNLAQGQELNPAPA